VNLPEGYAARPGTREDLDPIATLWDTWDQAYFGETGSANREELQYEWGAPWVDLERDTRVVHAHGGTLAAYVLHTERDPGDRFEVGAVVHPEHEGRGIGSAILTWTEEKTQAQLAPGSQMPVWNGTGAPNTSGLRLLQRNGYQHIRTFWQMILDLDPSFEAGPAPSGVVVRRNVVGVDDRDGYSAAEEAFATHFGYVPESFETWWQRGEADETFDPGLGLVAEVDGRIVGASMNGVIDGTGWVYELGVRPEWQRRGIGRALLRHTFSMFAAAGIRVARLGVDTENATGALELYRSLGMRPIREWRLFEKRIEAD
jgi:mycothiol synthase